MDLNYTSEDEAFRGHVRTWLPNTGQVRAQLGGSNPDTAIDATGAASAYVETGVNQYLMCKNY